MMVKNVQYFNNPIVAALFWLILLPQKSCIKTVWQNKFDDWNTCKALRFVLMMPGMCMCNNKSTKSMVVKLLYQVVFDAGSTGSRIHVFEFRQEERGIKLEHAYFEHVEPGLSYYYGEPKKSITSISGLLQKALQVIPKNKWTSTPVSLKATAGLRLLPQNVADDIMQEVRKFLFASPLKIKDANSVSILDGDDEGIFAWTTLNFLTENLFKLSTGTVGALDLGGGSTQIVFEPNLKETLQSSPATHIIKITIMGTDHYLYSFSYLGLGLMSARQAVLQLTMQSDNITYSPCFPPSYKGLWSYSGIDMSIQGEDSFGYENCGHYAEMIVNKLHKPAEIINRRFYAFSYFYDIAFELGLLDDPNGQLISVDSYIDAATRVCSNQSDEDTSSRRPFLCLDAVYATILLCKGYGFPGSQMIRIAKQINNVEVSWALGAALHALEIL